MGIQRFTRGGALFGSLIGNLEIVSSARITISTGHRFYGDLRVAQASTLLTQGGINLGGMTERIKKIHIAANWINGGGTSLRDTTYDVPYGSIIEDAWLNTVTKATSATNTVAVGIAGAADGLMTGVQPTCSWTDTVASIGSKLKVNSATSAVPLRMSYHTKASTNRSVTVSRSATTFSATWKGVLYIKYLVPSS